MKESDFISQNKENWQEFEEAVTGADTDPSRTSKLFIQITDDLSYARTFYANRSVVLYLNGVARVLFNDLNKTKGRSWKEFRLFWKKTLPLTIYKSRRSMLVSFIVFVCCFTIGVVTSMHDKDFAAAILGHDYVAMTEKNIKEGDPMAVYKSRNEVMTFFPILYNNLKVDFITFFSGIFMAIGSLVVMIGNGIMVGVFQYFFIERGLSWESFLGIWTHGALEIPTIILSGGAGLTFGRGLLFPGTYSRLQAFKASAKKGLLIILGVVPLTFIAAVVESFLTRHTHIPDPLRLGFIVLSATGVLLYYFYYPRIVARNTANEEDEDYTLIYKETEKFDPGRIRTGGKLISDTFHYFFNSFGHFSWFLFPGCIICAALFTWNPAYLFRSPDVLDASMEGMTQYLEFPALFVLTGISTWGLSLVAARYLKQKLANILSSEHQSKITWTQGPFTFLAGILLLASLFFMDFDLSLLVASILLPFVLFVGTVSVFANEPLNKAIGNAARLFMQSPGKALLVFMTLSMVSTMLYRVCRSGLNLLFIDDALGWVFTDDEVLREKLLLGFYSFQSMLALGLYVLLGTTASALLYFTLTESLTAGGLLKRIKSL